MKVAAVVQVRMGSTRLPGKALMKVEGQPLLGILLDRLDRSEALDGIVVATTERPEDDAIVDLCRERGHMPFRGDRDDVLKRYIGACDRYSIDSAVRVTGDNPLTDIGAMDQLVSLHIDGAADYSHCHGFALGTATEVVRADALRSIYRPDLPSDFLEHVTLYFHDRPQGFKVLSLENSVRDAPSFRLTVDTEKDLEFMKAIGREMGDLRRLSTGDVISFLRKRPELTGINSRVVQKDPRR